MSTNEDSGGIELEERMKFNLLYDFYSPLLTKRQRKIYEMVCFSDLTLAEVADDLKISRQAVYIMKRRVEAILEKFERDLKFVAITRDLENKIKELEKKLNLGR